MKRVKHYFYVPFTGLGNFNGFRGERWFRNRVKIFKQFVVPSLLAQTNKDFTVWISFTNEQRGHHLVIELANHLEEVGLKHIFTFHGICFYDDKYPLETARTRLITNLHGSIGELLDDIGDVDEVYMTIQPSDDCYYDGAVEEIQKELRDDVIKAVGYARGYICNYFNLEVSEYNPKTNPPFYTIKFPRDVFIEPVEHADYTATKVEVPGYPIGTPLPSHEWVKNCLRYVQLQNRGFLVGTHSENISTYYDHLFKGNIIDNCRLDYFGLDGVEPLKLKPSLRKTILRKLPFNTQKKLRHFHGRSYNWLRK